MVAFDWMQTANSMKPHDFELLVRAYCKRQAQRVREVIPGDHATVQVNFSVQFDTDGQMSGGQWRLCHNWGEDTKGEILHNIVDEHVRREVWASGEKGRLLQIEG